jgi:hypothetical protein
VGYRKKYYQTKEALMKLILLLALFLLAGCKGEPVWADIDYTNEQIANAIYKAEGGAKTRHPYGILTKYKHTTPKQACLNTIAHARRDFQGGDFISFLGSRYCPVGALNDPRGLNKNWVRNVKYFLNKRV